MWLIIIIIIIIISQPNIVSSVSSSIGPKQSVAILSSCKKKCSISEKFLPIVTSPSGLWTRWRKDLLGLPVRSMMGANNQGTTGIQPTNNVVKTKGHIVMLYTKGLCKSIKRICGRYGIQTHFKGNSTIKNLLVSPKDNDPMFNKSGAIYWFQCGDFTCNDKYIGETSRTFGERFKEHLKDPSPIHHHNNNTGHPATQQNFKIIGREGHGLARNIKESIFIRINNKILVNLIYPTYGIGSYLILLVLPLKGMSQWLEMLIPANLTSSHI